MRETVRLSLIATSGSRRPSALLGFFLATLAGRCHGYSSQDIPLGRVYFFLQTTARFLSILLFPVRRCRAWTGPACP